MIAPSDASRHLSSHAYPMPPAQNYWVHDEPGSLDFQEIADIFTEYGWEATIYDGAE